MELFGESTCTLWTHPHHICLFLVLSFFLLSFFPFRSEMSHWSVRTKIRLLRCGITQAVSMRLHKSQIWLRLSSQPPSAVLYHPPLPTQQLCWVGHGDMGKKGGRTWVKVKKIREFAETYKATLTETSQCRILFPVSSVSLVYNYWVAMKHNEKPVMLPNRWGKHAHQRVERHREREKRKLSSPTFILRSSCALIRKHHPCSPSPITPQLPQRAMVWKKELRRKELT